MLFLSLLHVAKLLNIQQFGGLSIFKLANILNHFFGVTHSRAPATLTNLKLEWSIICAKPRTTVSHFANPNHNQLGMIRIAELTQTSIWFHVNFLCFASWFADQLHMANSVPSVDPAGPPLNAWHWRSVGQWRNWCTSFRWPTASLGPETWSCEATRQGITDF